MRHWARWCATVIVASLVAAPLGAQGSGGVGDPASAPRIVVTNDMLINAAGSGDWLMYGHNYWNDRYSPLKTINTTNVKSLVARAVYTHGAERLGSFETTPIVVSGIMYITSPATPNNIVRAIVLRPQQPRRRDRRGDGVPRHARRQSGGARRVERKGEVGSESGRRPGRRLHGNHGPTGDRRQRDHRHLGRRVRHSRLCEGVQRL